MSSRVEIGAPGWQEAHLERYLRTDGGEGHLVDFSRAGGPAQTPCLILKTVGRKSGEARMLPLIYGEDGGRFVIVASKGGAAKHPAWFLNLEAKPEVEFQVVDKKYSGVARAVQGSERERLFAMMAEIFPPYLAYKARTKREIPVILLEPKAEVQRL
jgi:deazaflavin-dependent oxidoreductase (nitroreductase family)